MWYRLWQWLKGILSNLWRRLNKRSPKSQQKNLQPLRYTNYEFLFLELLEGVENGWQRSQLLQYLATWEDRATEADWIAWLSSFRERVLASSSPNWELGRRMVRLSEVGCGELGKVAGEIGSELLKRQPVELAPLQLELEEERAEKEDKIDREEEEETVVFSQTNRDETSLVDTEVTPQEAIRLRLAKGNVPPFPESSTEIASISEVESQQSPRKVLKNLGINPRVSSPGQLDSLDAILALLQQNRNLVQQLAREIGIETNNPQIILREIKVRAWIKEGFDRAQKGEFSRAIAACDRALAMQPNYALGWAARGDSLFQLKRYQRAVDDYDRATRLNPEDEKVWYNRGMALFKLQRYEEAIASFDQALALNEDWREAWNNRGKALEIVGRTEEAIASWQRANALNPNLHRIWTQQGIALLKLERYQEAIAACDKALDLEPNDRAALSCRNKSLAKLAESSTID